jgi:F0F1-type ATP synthase assembly protein I
VEKKKTTSHQPQKPKSDNKKTSGLKSFARYSSMGFQMIATILIFYWAGSKLDERSAGEKPLYTAILTVVGVLAGIYIGLKDFIHTGDD